MRKAIIITTAIIVLLALAIFVTAPEAQQIDEDKIITSINDKGADAQSIIDITKPDTKNFKVYEITKKDGSKGLYFVSNKKIQCLQAMFKV